MQTNFTKRIVLLVSLIPFTSCAPGQLSGGQQGAKKDSSSEKPSNSNSSEKKQETSSNSDDASEPQVVTGSYLSCVQDASSGASLNESEIGCGVYSPNDDKKSSLGKAVLALEVKDTCGGSPAVRVVDEPAESLFHKKVFVRSDNCSKLSISGQITSQSGASLAKFDRRIIHLRTVRDGFELKRQYSSIELTEWCNLATLLPHDQNNRQRVLVKGAACGADYLKAHGSQAQPVVDILSEFSSLGDLLPNFLANAGVCEQKHVTLSYEKFVKRCQ